MPLVTRAAIGATILVVTGCTWVKTTPESETVRVLKAEAITTCRKVGHTTPSLLHKVAGINRSQEKVAKELETLARHIAGTESRLANKAFTDKAPPAVIDGARKQLADQITKRDELTRLLQALS